MRNIVVILAMFVCTSICLGLGDKPRQRIIIESALNTVLDNIAGNGNPDKKSVNYANEPDDGCWHKPVGNRLIIKNSYTRVGDASGAYMDANTFDTEKFELMTDNEVIVSGGKFGCGRGANGDIAGACAADIDDDINVSSNTVIITGGTDINNVVGGSALKGTVSSNTVTISNSVTIGKDVYGGYIVKNGTAILNKVNLTSVTVRMNVYGARIGEYGYESEIYGLASSNEVTITSGTVKNVYGGYIVKNGTATLNKVNLTSVTVRINVYGAKIGNDGDEDKDKAKKVVGDVLASSNEVTITGGRVGRDVYGGYIHQNGTATGNKVTLTNVDVKRDVYGAMVGRGLASSNEVTITGGRVGRDVLGGYIHQNGTATGNKVTLTNVDVKRDVYGAIVGTDKKAEFERAEEVITEASERVLASLAKFAKYEEADEADETEFKRVVGATIAESKRAVPAVKALKDFNSLAEAAAEAEKAEFERDREAITKTFEETFACLVVLAEADKDYIVKAIRAIDISVAAERAEFKKDIKDGIKKVEDEIANFRGVIAGIRGCVIAGIERAEATYVLASSNTVTITSGTVGRNVYGGYVAANGTATLNKVNLISVTATKDVHGAWIGKDGLASSNTVTINGGTVGRNVFGGYIVKDGTATGNKVNLTSVTATKDVYGAKIGRGLASSNEVTITSGRVGRDVLGGYIWDNGTATGNTVTISGGKVKGNVFGGYVGGNGEATHNTINITATEQSSKQSFPEFSPESILCGGICDPETKSNAFTGNTLNIENEGSCSKRE